MSELDRMRSDLENKERELNSMKRHVSKDVEWRPGVQDQSHSEVIEYDEYTDNSRANQLERDIKSLKEKIDNYAYEQERKRELESKRRQQAYSATTEKIASTAKAKYDATVNAYMEQNLFGKVKMILTGKKPKKMNRNEIMDTYGEEAKNIEMQKAIDYETQLYLDDVEETKRYYSEHPEALNPNSDTYNSIENILKEKKKLFDQKISKIKVRYAGLLEDSKEFVDEGTIKLWK